MSELPKDSEEAGTTNPAEDTAKVKEPEGSAITDSAENTTVVKEQADDTVKEITAM